ncbi:hypothetical protein HAX54_036347 [Datura stramonium]|uniref:Uncharacterized protein n=1 Tax=Datura stramonium TaxID=4076 RepID=A0ABS8VI56_DATST|nr:hypothetical protein [Datura stramonium]
MIHLRIQRVKSESGSGREMMQSNESYLFEPREERMLEDWRSIYHPKENKVQLPVEMRRHAYRNEGNPREAEKMRGKRGISVLVQS